MRAAATRSSSYATFRKAFSRRREGAIELGEVLVRKRDVERGTVVPHMRLTPRFRDHQHVTLPEHKGERDLRRRHAVPSRDQRERAVAQEAPLLDRRIGHDRHAVLAAPGEQPRLYAAAP